MKLVYNEEANVNDLLDKLTTFARHKGYGCRKVGRDVLEISKTNTFLLLVGLSVSLRIVVTIKRGRTDVDFGDYQKEYIIKAIIGFISIGLPLLLPLPIYGAYRQYKLVEDAQSEVNDYFNSIV